jgi:hypothetical protein
MADSTPFYGRPGLNTETYDLRAEQDLAAQGLDGDVASFRGRSGVQRLPRFAFGLRSRAGVAGPRGLTGAGRRRSSGGSQPGRDADRPATWGQDILPNVPPTEP